LREVFRKNKSVINPPSDLVINTSSITAGAAFALLEEEFRRVFLQANGAKDECSN
jgi:RNase P protein component